MTRGRLAGETDRTIAPAWPPSFLALLLFALAAAPLQAQPNVPAPGAGIVVDAADVITADREQFLIDGLLGFEQTQRRRVAVVTVPDLQGYDIADYGSELARVWGLRDPGNDGAVLIVAPTEMKVRIEVGSAVRSDLPEEVAQEIIETWVLPGFRQGDMVNGILNGAGAILIHLELPPEEAAAIAEQARIEQEAQARESEEFLWSLLKALLGLILLAILWPIVRGTFGLFGWGAGAIFLLGRGGGGFGGFGGGGGGFNGGGASGRW